MTEHSARHAREPTDLVTNTPGPQGIVVVPESRTAERLPLSPAAPLSHARDSSLRPIRRDARVGRPPRHPQWLLNQLPVGMMDSDFFVRFVALFQELGSTLLDDADLLESIPDIAVTPAPLLPLLAGWIGVESVDASLPDHLQRTLVASSAKALAWRGTSRGIKEYLEMLSGDEALLIDSGGVYAEGAAPIGPAWLRMTVVSTGHLSESEFVSMIRDEVPATVRAELWVGVRRIWSNFNE
ncbi:phage tail protein [Nakamurella antarctica]|uniref:Phage tail protein n=1 Tax=Nakamurella antarctica TaxID=1902245 RepID=A0A3G8ZLC3_9ACTN|nr:phage tail protein [Nakamurella antarctica]AZI58010.1 phage tail protein [Nakamurella antarctica]